MRILHLLSQLQPTGAEFYAVALAEWQRAQGHKVWIVSDNLFAPTDIPFTPFPIGNRKYIQRFKNARFIKKFVQEHQIAVVHAHSRAASWVANRSLKQELVPLVSTVHGRQHIHASSKRKNIYGQKVMAVCDNINQHLVSELNLPSGIVSTVPNCIEPPTPKKGDRVSSKVTTLSLIGRTTGPKGESASELITSVFPELIKKYDDALLVQVIGGERENLSAEAQEILSRYPKHMKALGFVDDLAERITQSDIVIASGRSAVEAFQAGKSVFALGEASYEGEVTEENIEACFNSNFGDVSATDSGRDILIEKVLVDLERRIGGSQQQNAELIDQVNQFYSTEAVAEQVMEKYCQARALKASPSHIPALMYHKVPKAEIKTRHKTFIVADRLEKHFRYLKWFKYSPITFKEYYDFYCGKRPWSQFPKKPIFLTFDDGYLDNYENLLPLLDRYCFRITLFCLADERVVENQWDLADEGEESCPLMNFSQMRAFVDQGSEIGAHGLTHVNLQELEKSGKYNELERELNSSKDILNQQLGVPITTFAYPYGKSTQEIRQRTARAGYQMAVSTDSGGQHIEDDHFHIFRVNVFPEDGWLSLLKKASPSYRSRFFRTRGR